MNLQLLSSNLSRQSPLLLFPRNFPQKSCSISATLESVNGNQLTARERRQLRNEKRETKTYNWREEVEERLLKKPEKKYTSWKDELNLDNLALLGTQWWVVRVSRVSGQEIAKQMARSLVRNFPDMDFQVYVPAVRMKRKLKNGKYSDKMNPLFPGCVFLRCVLNKELHDFIRECNGVGGFLGSIVGNTKRQINRPKPVPEEDMDAVFKQAKEEQEQADREFEIKHRMETIFSNEEEPSTSNYSDPISSNRSVKDIKTKRKSRKDKNEQITSLIGKDYHDLVIGSSVQVMSGPLTEFTGCLKNLNFESGKATVGFMLFGKESIADVDINQLAIPKT